MFRHPLTPLSVLRCHSVDTRFWAWGMSLFQVCSPHAFLASRPGGTLTIRALLAGVLLSLNIRLDYMKNVNPFSPGSYFGYSCIGPCSPSSPVLECRQLTAVPVHFLLCAGYAVGLAMADAAVMLTGLGQPALLYLVPCTLGLVRLIFVSSKSPS